MFRYGVVRLTSALLRIVGLIGVLVSIVLFIPSIANIAPRSGAGLENVISASFGVLLVYSSASLFVSSMLMIAVGQMLQIFVDIALNTRPIAELVDASRSSARFFDAMLERQQGTVAIKPT